jgi:hypothetical protein
MNYSRPLVPEDLRRPRGIHVERAIIAAAKAAVDATKTGPENTAKKLWPNDPVTPLLLRAATSPTSTTSASALAINTALDFVSALAPLSAAARLIDAGMRVSLAGRNSVSFPRRVGGKAASNVAWIAQGSPIPVKQFALDASTLGPTCKLALLVGLTRELVEYTSGQDTVSTLMREDFAASLDATMFSATTGANQPNGLLVGVTPLTAEPTLPDAMLLDFEKLAGAVLNAGGTSVVYIASPRQAASAGLRLLTDATIWPCPALAPGTVIAVEPSAFVSAFGPEPRIGASVETAVHFEAATPLAIGAAGNVVAAPTRSAFQEDLVIVRAVLDAAWTMRAPGMVAFITGAIWGAP